MAFVCLNIEKKKSFVMSVCLLGPSITDLADAYHSRVLRYFVSTALVLWLSSLVFGTDSSTLPPYIPTSVDIGILLTYCLNHTWQELRKGIRRVWTRFRDWSIDRMIRMLLPGPRHHEVQLLPLHDSPAAAAAIVLETERSIHWLSMKTLGQLKQTRGGTKLWGLRTST